MMRFLLCLFIFVASCEAYTQTCPVCAIDLTCDSVPAAPKLCPAELPMDTAQQYYSADLTFYMPKVFSNSQYSNINLNQIDVLGVTGLPAGMSWTAYNYLGVATTSFYPPANPPASERGCAKICGTPPMPFDDSITVSVIAYVTVSGVNATQNTAFKVHLKIVPNPSGNSVFSMDNSQSCDPLTVNFTPNLASNGSSMITYNWNFGNGNTSTGENVSQTYNTPGNYTVTCTTKVYQYVITALNLSALNSNWCGDVEEWSCTFSNPDVFFEVNNNGGISTSDTIWNDKTPIFSNLSFPLEGTQFTLYFFDADDGPPFGSATDSLGYKTITVSGNGGTYNFNTTSPFSGTQGSVTVSKQIKNTYIDSDHVHFYAPPALTPVAFSPNDTVCSGTSATLSINSGFSNYQWYRDTLLLNGETSSTLTTFQNGNYWVHVTNSFGCSKNSNSQKVTVLPLPFAAISANGPTTFCQGKSVIFTSVTANSYLWSTGQTTQSITVSSSGNYWVVITNASGCSDTSVAIAVTVKTSPAATVTANGATTFCEGDSVLLSATAAATYLWSTGQFTQSITVFSSGNYSVTTANATGCSATSAPLAVTANANPAPSITVTGSTAFCQGDTATLSASSASAYLWNTGAITQSILISSAGIFSVTVTDANGCSAATTDTVNDPGSPTVSVSSVNVTVFGACTGSATAAITGGVTPYTYHWSANANNQTTATATGLCAGTYNVTVSDANNCTSSATVTITEPPSGISEKSGDFNIAVFPNPTSGNFTVSMDGITTEKVQIKLFNVLGEVVYMSNLKTTMGKYLQEINPGNVPPGIYFVQVSVGNKIFNKRILIQ